MENLVSQGLPLALFGVGVVFVFFCLLIAATSAMSWLAAGFGQAPGQASGQREDTVMPPAQMAAVIAAIAMHRARRLGACAVGIRESENSLSPRPRPLG